MKPTTTDDPVRRALAAVAEADRSRHAPPHLERAVLEALDRQVGRPHLFGMSTVWVGRYAAILAALVLTVTTTIYFNRDHVVDAPARDRAVHSDIHPSMARPADGHVAQFVRVRLPRAMLPMLGVPIIDPDAPGTVNVEVILREDGLAETIRIVP